MGDGANYDDAFFEINYLRAYSNGVVEPSATIGATSLPDGSPQTVQTESPDSSTGGAASQWFPRWTDAAVMGGMIMTVVIAVSDIV